MGLYPAAGLILGMLMHAHHLEETYGCGPHTISVPRIRPADDIDPDTFDNGVPDDVFKRIVAVLRIAVPYTGMIMSTRESAKTRRECLEIGITQISGGSRTSNLRSTRWQKTLSRATGSADARITFTGAGVPD